MMRNQKTVTVLTVSIALFSAFATLIGILSNGGSGKFHYESIRGKAVEIYGSGIYKHMSAEVAIQGIAQDFVTFFIGIPLLLTALYFSRKGSFRSRFILTGITGYFFVTYLFYLVMGMYSALFLVYVILAGVSFFALSLNVISLRSENSAYLFDAKSSVKFPGWFLITNSVIIGLLWLQVVLPPLFDGSIYPDSLEHYTTLIVQGLDLSILLPLSFIAGYQLLKKSTIGYLIAPVYLVFLSLLMAALVAKITCMGLEGYHIIPAIFIIPVLNMMAVYAAISLLKKLEEPNPAQY